MSFSDLVVRNLSGVHDISRHLNDCSEHFVPPLKQRVNLNEYSRKLFEFAERFECWRGDLLAGLVAVYCNDKPSGVAHVSSVSVLNEYSRLGIASRLLGAAVDHVHHAGFSAMSLRVHTANMRAKSLYEGLGFEYYDIEDEQSTIEMRLTWIIKS